MKAAIWIVGFLVMFIVKYTIFHNQSLGGIGEALFWSVWLIGAPFLCKRWDKRKAEKKSVEQPHDETTRT